MNVVILWLVAVSVELTTALGLGAWTVQTLEVRIHIRVCILDISICRCLAQHYSATESQHAAVWFAWLWTTEQVPALEKQSYSVLSSPLHQIRK